MSYAAERWARSQKVGNASAKFVLIELANALNKDDVECYPGIDTLEESTELNRKTVLAATKLLEEKGFIKKRRACEKGKQRIYYSFPSFNPADWEFKKESTENGTLQSTKSGTYVEQSPKNGTLESSKSGTQQSTKNGILQSPKSGTYVEKSPKNGTLESPKNGSQQSTENGILQSPKNGPVTGNKNREIEQVIETHDDAAPEGTLFPEQISPEKKKRTPTDRGSRLTLEHLPDTWRTFAKQTDPDLDPDLLWANFHDYWTSVSGSKGIKKDWEATWRNFVRSFNNAPDWKRNPVLKKKVVSTQTVRAKVYSHELTQEEREAEGWGYGID